MSTQKPMPARSLPLPSCLRADGDGCELRLRVVPNASRTSCAGLHDEALRVRLMAPPIEGRANAALLAWLADELGVPRRALTLRSGDTQRIKRIAIDAPPERVASWLAGQLAGIGSGRAPPVSRS